jgi:hypothetical protein
MMNSANNVTKIIYLLHRTTKGEWQELLYVTPCV